MTGRICVAPPDMSKTLALLHEAKSGNSASMVDLVEIWRERLLLRIRLMMGPRARDRAESSDFLQDLMVDMLAGLPAFEPRDERSFLNWLIQIAKNNIIDTVRRPREQRFADLAVSTVGAVADAGHDDPALAAGAREAEERLVHAIERLPTDMQVVLELREFDGLSFAEIGERMQRTENAAQLLHARAKVRLGALLAGDGG